VGERSWAKERQIRGRGRWIMGSSRDGSWVEGELDHGWRGGLIMGKEGDGSWVEGVMGHR
jgi:hypothetical protein